MDYLARCFTLAVTVLAASTAFAVAPQRTFVASTGSDANPCTLTAPCRGFQAAINAVAAGGEVVTIDSAGYGTMEIHKSVSVTVPPGVHAGLSPSTGIPLPGFPGQSTVVLIDIQSTDTVVLRGLNVNQQGTVTGGIHWLSANGGTVHVENTTVNGFTNAGLFLGAPNGRMFVKDSIFRNNGYGIYQLGTEGTLVSYLSADHVRIENSTNTGIVTDVHGRATISDSVISVNNVGIAALTSTLGGVEISVTRCVLSQNFKTFKLFSGAVFLIAAITVAASTIINGPELLEKSGPGNSNMISFGNNSMDSAIFDLTFPLR